ncbi:MAG: hypothetical protein V1721_06915 [Pseudomonadota bacterium]
MFFSAMIDQLFTDPVLSKPSTYLAVGTSVPFPVRVISRQPDTVVGFGEGQLHVPTTLFDVRSLEVPEPAVGDQLTYDDIIYTVQSEPKSDRDHLVWTLDVRPV